MKKILLVEDSQLYKRVLLRRIDEVLRRKAEAVSTYAEAVALVSEDPAAFDIALLDLNLPDAPNGEIVEYIVSQGIPCVVFTGEFRAEVQDFVWARPVIDYVTKDGAHSIEYVVSLIDRIQRNRRTKILVVDDSAFERKNYQKVLGRHQYQLLLAENGRHALEALENNADVMLVLTDYHMPEMDGFELVTHIRAQYSLEQLAVIGLSSAGEDKLAVRFIKHGANDFITKPFVPDQLYCRIAQNIKLVERFHELGTQQVALRKEVDERRRAEKALQESELRYRTIVELLPDPLIVESGGKIQYLNRAALDLLGTTDPETVMSLSLVDLVETAERDRAADFIANTAQREGSAERLEVHLERLDGRKICVRIQAMCTLYEGDVGVQIALSDITEQRERESELKELSARDALTGVANRRSLDAALAREWKRLSEANGSLGIIMIDIDYFKKYNDHFGHQQGDKCLRQVALALERCPKRPRDLVARYGGEEFSVLLPEATPEAAARIAENLRADVEALQLEHPESKVTGVVTVSIGIAVGEAAPHASPEGLLAKADEALYQAKRSGRNQVCFASPGEAEETLAAPAEDEAPMAEADQTRT